MKKVLMVVYSYFPSDTRVRREADALINNGYQVDVLCLRNSEQSKIDFFEGINVYRVNLSKIRSNKFTYVLLYIVFFIFSFVRLNILDLKKKYDVFHVHNMPDFLVFTTVLQKILGKRVILDLHDPMPEIYQTKYGLKNKSLFLAVIKLQEKLSFSFADKVITTNIAFVEAFGSRGNEISKIQIVMNSPQENVFGVEPYQRKDADKNKFIIMYHGTIVERHGLDIAVEAVKELQTSIPELEFWIFGQGEFLDDILLLIEKYNLQNKVFYKGGVALDVIAKTIPMINLGLIPNKKSHFTNINFPVRIFEYIYFRKPVIVPLTKGISDYFKEDEIFYFNSENSIDLSRRILDIYNNNYPTSLTIEKSYKVFEKHRWSFQSQRLINLYENL